jgi:hypothetical protein
LTWLTASIASRCPSIRFGPNRLPSNVYRLLLRLQLTELPERDAMLVASKLSRRDLRGDEFGTRTLDLVDEWLSKFAAP